MSVSETGKKKGKFSRPHLVKAGHLSCISQIINLLHIYYFPLGMSPAL